MKTGVATAQKQQRQLGPLQAKLNDLSGKIEAAKVRLESYQFDQEAHTKLQQLLKELSATRDSLQPEVARLEREHTASVKKLADIGVAISAKEAELDAATKLHTTTKDQRDLLVKEVAQLREDKRTLKAGKTQKSAVTRGEISADIVQAQKELKHVTDLLTSRSNKAKALKTKEDRYATIVAAIESADAALVKVNGNIKQREADEIKAKAKVDELEAQLLQMRTDFDAECKKKTTALNLREKGLEEREGDVVRREQWNDKRTGLLRNAKTELEEIHGRPLRHIVIPPAEDPEAATKK